MKPPVTLDQFGDVLSREDVMTLFQIPSRSALYSRIQSRQMLAPDLTMPSRWFKVRIAAWMNGQRLGVAVGRRRAS